jgi:hypothetical protein
MPAFPIDAVTPPGDPPNRVPDQPPAAGGGRTRGTAADAPAPDGTRPDQRRHERIACGNAMVAVDGTLYPVEDVSIGGFRLAGYEGGLTAGGGFDFVFHLGIDGRATACAGHGLVRRRDGSSLAAAFVMDDPGFYATLCRFIESEKALRISYGGHGPAGTAAPSPAFVRETI